MDIPDRVLFGQFLIEQDKITSELLTKALMVQNKEKITNHQRMLGTILYNDFGVFEDRIELKRYLDDFTLYREKMDKMYYTAKVYGAQPEKKLEEFADLLEEIETDETLKVRKLIKKLDEFKLMSKKLEAKENELEVLKLRAMKAIHERDDEIKRLKNRIREIKMARDKEVIRVNNYVRKLKEEL